MSLQGTLESFPAVDVLRLLANSSKSGTFVADGERGPITLFIDGGAIVGGQGAKVGLVREARRIREIMFDLLRTDVGQFHFEDDDIPDSPLSLDVEGLIVDGEQDIAEWLEIIATVPSTEQFVMLRPDLSNDTVTLDRRSWEGVLTVGLGVTVETLGSRLALGELESLRLVRDLVVLGVVKLTEAPTPTEPATASSTSTAPPAADSQPTTPQSTASQSTAPQPTASQSTAPQPTAPAAPAATAVLEREPRAYVVPVPAETEPAATEPGAPESVTDEAPVVPLFRKLSVASSAAEATAPSSAPAAPASGAALLDELPRWRDDVDDEVVDGGVSAAPSAALRGTAAEELERQLALYRGTSHGDA